MSVPSRSISSIRWLYSPSEPSHHTTRLGAVRPEASSTHFSTNRVVVIAQSSQGSCYQVSASVGATTTPPDESDTMPFAFFPPSDGIQTLYPGTTSGINPENAQKIQKMPENAGAPVNRSLGEQAGEDRVELTA